MALVLSGQVVLFRFPQTDLNKGKLRPALLLAPLPNSFGDWLACMVSSKKIQKLPQFDETIYSTDKDFTLSGLKSESVLRVTRVAVVSEKVFLGSLGSISSERLQRIKKNLAAWILS